MHCLESNRHIMNSTKRYQVNIPNKERIMHSKCTEVSISHSEEFPRVVGRQSSLPIPIKNMTDPNSERDSSLLDSVDSEYYNQLTWRMYNRIMEARKIRALIGQNSSSSSSSSSSINFDGAYSPTDSKLQDQVVASNRNKRNHWASSV